MRELIAGGLAAGEAARSLLDAEAAEPARARAWTGACAGAGDRRPAGGRARRGAGDARRRAARTRSSTAPVAALSLDALLADVMLAAMREIGRRWESGEVGIGEEHFASNLIRARLVALARGWGAGAGPLAVLACPPGEQHDLGLIAFGLALRARGWRIAYLGQDTPIESAAQTAERLDARLVVLAAATADALRPHVAELRGLAGLVALRLGGPGAAPRAGRGGRHAAAVGRPGRSRAAGRGGPGRCGRDDPRADRVPGRGAQRRRRHPAADERGGRPGDRRRRPGPRDPALHAGSPTRYGEEEARQWQRMASTGLRTGTELPTLIVDATDGRLLGAVALHNLDPESGRCSAGYWVAAEERRRGVARRALGLLCGYAFAELGVKRIELWIEPGNAASLRVAETVGFAREGLLRSFMHVGGRRRDMLMYSLLPGELS